MTKFHSHILGGAVVLSGLFASELAKAQDAPAAAAPAAPPAPAAEAPPPAPPPAAPPADAAPAAPAATPMPMAETPPPPPPADNPFKVTVGAGFRSALRIQNPITPGDKGTTKLNDQFLDELNLELRTSGKVTDIIGWTGNFTVDGRSRAEHGIGAPIAFQAQALDLIGQLDFMDEFHVWMGRMLTPSDRSNFSGPWFMPAWNYSGGTAFGYFGPRGTEEVGRETGFTVWGDINKGKFKYYAAILDLDGNYGAGVATAGGFANSSPLYSVRAQYAILGSEPGFYGSSTYYGGQDILAIGAAFQYQKDYECASGTWNCGPVGGKDNLTEFNADLLFEKKLDAGTPGIEAAYYHESGDTRSFNDFFYVMPTFTTGEVLPAKGKLNALFRFQMAKLGEDKNGVNTKSTVSVIEPSVAYLFKDYFAKLQLSYTMAINNPDADGLPTAKSQYLQLGFQVQQ